MKPLSKVFDAVYEDVIRSRNQNNQENIPMDKMKGDSYATPSWLKDLFEGWFDPCTLSKGEFREFDGLGSSWGGGESQSLCKSSLLQTSSLGKEGNTGNEERKDNSNASKGRYFNRILPALFRTWGSSLFFKKDKVQWQKSKLCFCFSNI